ncbi:MAG TPA: TlpA disulfide reductase family protein [Flavisolibacter sp.]|nr:TlpA disulfide reductase family protein [Flavisolibacter sp.]
MKSFLTLLAFFPIVLFAQNQATGFEIKGNISGLADGKVQIVSLSDDHALVASDSAKNGQFTLKGSVTEPTLYYIVLSNEQPQYLYLENKPITITGSQKDIKNIKIEGSQSHTDFVQFNKIFNPLIAELNGFAALLQREQDEKKREDLFKKYDSVVKKVDAEVGNFVASKKSSFVSAFLLSISAQVTPDPMVMEQRFNMLSEEVRNSEIGKGLANSIAYFKVGAVGTDALEFTQNDVQGNPVKLSAFKGKYVLLDFWASWCKPCRLENPNVVKVYNKFKNKNFTVLGVSLDQSKDAWVKAIDADKLAWNHVSDLQQWNNAVAQMYHVQSIPGNFLIDPSGKIVAKDLRGEDLEKKLCELLGCN